MEKVYGVEEVRREKFGISGAFIYIFMSVLGFIIFALTLLFRLPHITDLKSVFVALADAATIPAVAFISTWVLSFAANSGVFDVFGYAFVRIFPFMAASSKKEKYSEYRVAKRRRLKLPFAVFAVGLSFLCFSSVFIFFSALL